MVAQQVAPAPQPSLNGTAPPQPVLQGQAQGQVRASAILSRFPTVFKFRNGHFLALLCFLMPFFLAQCLLAAAHFLLCCSAAAALACQPATAARMLGGAGLQGVN